MPHVFSGVGGCVRYHCLGCLGRGRALYCGRWHKKPPRHLWKALPSYLLEHKGPDQLLGAAATADKGALLLETTDQRPSRPGVLGTPPNNLIISSYAFGFGMS